MADIKTSELTELDALSANDLLNVSEDQGESTYISKKVKYSKFSIENYSYPANSESSAIFYIDNTLSNAVYINMTQDMEVRFNQFPSPSDALGILYIKPNEYTLTFDPLTIDGIEYLTHPSSSEYNMYLYSAVPEATKARIKNG